MFTDMRMGRSVRRYLYFPEDAHMQVPDGVLKSVVFIGYVGANEQLVTIGTGFFVTVPINPAFKEMGRAGYLVAAKHVVVKLERKPKPHGILVRLKDGGRDRLALPNDATWWFHPTQPDSVDAAVTPISINFPEVDVQAIQDDAFYADDVKPWIGPGDEVFIPGLFTRLPYEPIIRTGNIAAMPRKPFPGWSIAGGTSVEAEGYIIEVRSLGGLSGSPIFVRQAMVTMVMGEEGRFKDKPIPMVTRGPFFLLGLMHGHWKLNPEEHDRVDFQTTQQEGSIALGLSVAVPITKIREILDQPGLVAKRLELELEWRERFGTTVTD